MEDAVTDEELEALGKQMWKLHHDEADPILKSIFGLIHKQTVEARKPDAPPALRDFLMASLRDLSRALKERGHRSR